MKIVGTEIEAMDYAMILFFVVPSGDGVHPSLSIVVLLKKTRLSLNNRWPVT
jgi:hypothetical protein